MIVRRFAPVLWLALLASPFPAQSFQPGDVSKLVCRVILPRGQHADQQPLVVEVTNRGKLTAEPVSFDVFMDFPEDGSGRLHHRVDHRAGRRVWGRAGRAIPPGGKLRYWLPAVWGGKALLEKTSVTVTRASFFRGKGRSKPPVRILSLEDFQAMDDFTHQPVKRTQVSVQNLTDFAVDVIFRATPKPKGAPRLFAAHLAPRAKRILGTDANRDLMNEPIDRSPTYGIVEGRFSSLDVIDWSVLVDDGAALAKDLLEPAWRDFYRWPVTSATEVVGKAAFALRKLPADDPFEGSIRFRLKLGGPGSRLEAEPPVDAALQGQLLVDVGRSLHPMTHLSFEELEDRCSFTLVDAFLDGSVQVWVRSKTRRTYVLTEPVLLLRDGRIQRTEEVNPWLRRVTTIKSVDLEDGRYAPAEMKTVSIAQLIARPPLVVERRFWTYRARDGIVQPETAKREAFEEFTGNARYRTELRFENIAFEGPRELGAPTGEGLAYLRRAWEKPYRYPPGAVNFEGSLRIDCETTQEDWASSPRIEGRLKLEGWTGRPSASNVPFATSRLRPKGRFSASAKRQIDDLFRARMSIWTRQDFSGRPLFDVFFRGCKIHAPDAEGWLKVEGHERVAAVRIDKGRPVAVRDRSGEVHRRRFAKVKGFLVPVETRWAFDDREALITVTYREMGRGLLVPRRIVMRDWFLPGWGPETYDFRLRRR
ncbi:MAG TPA: hypothetical protein ENK43_17325 [Planctomycetes bacterium]|nr:hypothetical protein [Planctomycetota bacterium]